MTTYRFSHQDGESSYSAHTSDADALAKTQEFNATNPEDMDFLLIVGTYGPNGKL
jgi:hypothetical protein